MIQEIVNAVVDDLTDDDAIEDYDVIAAFDQGFSLEDSGGVVVVVSGAAEPFTADTGGNTLAWKVTITITAATHQAEDKSGAVRNSLAAAALAYLKSPTPTLTGYQIDAVVERNQSGVETMGDEFLSVASSAALIVEESA